MSIRIISGEYRGRNITTPDITDFKSPVRPTKAMVREAMFNTISSRMDLENAYVLDLFAGSGAAGIEALSRGAKHVTFVDTDTKYIDENIKNLKIDRTRITTHRADATNLPPMSSDLIIADAPYGMGLTEKVISKPEKYGKTGSYWMIETEARLELPVDESKFDLIRYKKYGKSALWLLEQK